MVLLGQPESKELDDAVLAKVVKSRNSVRLSQDFDDADRTRYVSNKGSARLYNHTYLTES